MLQVEHLTDFFEFASSDSPKTKKKIMKCRGLDLRDIHTVRATLLTPTTNYQCTWWSIGKHPFCTEDFTPTLAEFIEDAVERNPFDKAALNDLSLWYAKVWYAPFPIRLQQERTKTNKRKRDD